MHASDWITSSIATAALLIAAASFIYSRRATKAAERQAAVSERAEKRRLAEADRTAVFWALDFRWEMGPGPLQNEHVARLRFTNNGSARALNAHVTLPAGCQIIDGSDEAAIVEPGLSLDLAVVPQALLGSTAHLQIEWQVHDPGPRYSFQRPWQPRPPDPQAY